MPEEAAVELAPDVLERVLAHVDWPTAMIFARVCRAWRQAASRTPWQYVVTLAPPPLVASPAHQTS
jgi:hypothetical protein